MTKTLNDVISKQLSEIDSFEIEKLEEDGLFSGKLGLLYFYLMLYRHDNKITYKEKIEQILGLIFNNIEEETSSLMLSSSLGDGLSGLGYVLNELKKDGFIGNDFDEQISTINELAFDACISFIDEDNFDYTSGSIGILFYLASINAENYVSQIVDALHVVFKENDHTFYNNAGYIEGVHIGYAHGLCAIVKVLNEVPDNEKADYIIEKILASFLDTCSSSDTIINESKYFLPRSLHEDKGSELRENWRPVLAWSNSDLNFSTLVYTIDTKYVNPTHFEYANKILEESAKRRKYDQTRLADYRFSFGTAGTAQLYAKLESFTPSTTAKEMHSYWINETLNLLSEDNCDIKEHKFDLLHNIPATILTLIQFRDAHFTNWDKLFLL